MPEEYGNSAASIMTGDSADISISVKTDKDSPKPGDTVTFTINARNSGPVTAAGPTVSYTPPQQLTNVEYSTDGGSAWTPWPADANSADLEDIPKDGDRGLLIRGTVLLDAAGDFENDFEVDSPTHDPNEDDNRASAPVTVAEPEKTPSYSNLETAVKADKENPIPGDIVTYTVTVKNHGPAVAISPSVDFDRPPALGNVHYSTDEGSTWQPWAGGVTLGDIPAGTGVTVLVRGEIPVSLTGSVGISVTAVSVNQDPNLADNTAAVTTTVTATAELVTEIISDNPAPNPGDGIIYTVNVHNNGPSAATAPSVKFTPPVSLTGVEYSTDSGATWQPWTGSAALADLGSGGDAKLLIRAKVSETAAETIEMTLAATSNTGDPGGAGSTATASVPVAAKPAEAPAAPAAGASGATHTVKYYCNGCQYGCQTVQSGKAIPAPPPPKRRGYVFAGWFTADAAKDAKASRRDFAAPVTGDISLYAGFTPVCK